jgi:glucan phosphoethanolaminetransferase (alkaline phosphatase superfamily)
MFKELNPFKLILYWLAALVIAGLIIIPILFATTTAGEQKPLTFLVYLWLMALWGTVILAVITPFFYFTWFKKYWLINLLLFLFAAYYVSKGHLHNAGIEYSFKEKTEMIDNREIRTVKQYYSFDPERIRSVSYWKDGKKDSVWTVYSESGTIISETQYEGGRLIKKRNSVGNKGVSK